MKQVIRSFCRVAVLLILLSGCASMGQNSTTASPGPVLGLGKDDGNSQKVVTFEVIGKGLEPENAVTRGEGKIMAERAAVADGYRQLVEKLSGVYVDAFMKAGFGTVNKDMITTKTQSWLRGVDIVEIRSAEYGITEAVMELSIYFTKKDMVWWPSGLGPRVRPVEEGGMIQTNLSRNGN